MIAASVPESKAARSRRRWCRSRRASTAARPASRQWTLPIAASIAAVIGGLAGYWAANTERTRAGRAMGRRCHQAGARRSACNGRVRQGNQARRDQRPVPGNRHVPQRCAGAVPRIRGRFADRSTVMSVACRSGDEWRVSFAVVAPGDAGGYAPASSAEALDAYLVGDRSRRADVGRRRSRRRCAEVRRTRSGLKPFPLFLDCSECAE